MDVGAQSIEQFVGDIASENVSPAGGSAVAITGAIGAALCEMTCIHTLKSHPEGPDLDVKDVRSQLASQRSQLLQLASQDARIIEAVYSRSSPDPSQADIKRLLGIPLSVAELCLDVFDQGARIVAAIDRAVVADAKTGIILANASFAGAIVLVNSNLDDVSDRAFADQIDGRVGELLQAADEIAEDLPGNLPSNHRRV